MTLPWSANYRAQSLLILVSDMGDERGKYDTDGEEEEGECGDSTDEEEGGHEEDDGGHEDSCDPNGLFDALAAAQEAAER